MTIKTYKIIISSFALLLSLTGALANAEDWPDRPPADAPAHWGAVSANFEEIPYPYPVQFLSLNRFGEEMRMAYMDVPPSGRSNGQTVFWQHGMNFYSEAYTPTLKKLSEEGFRVLAVDRIGYGKSSKPIIPYNFNFVASNMKALLDELGIEEAAIVGHSMGGMIVQEMAKKDGDKILKLVCYSTGPRGEMPGRFETVEQSRENLKKKGLEVMAKNIAKTWFIKGEDAKYFDICIEAGKQSSMESADNALIACKNWNGVDTLKNIKNETLIVWGDQDKSYNLEQIQILEHNIENSKLIIFKNCAHNVHLEQPDQFNKTIKDFLL